MSDNQNIDTTTNINETDTNKTSTDHSDDYEKICYVCRRPESKAGEMITMPGGMNFCHECKHLTRFPSRAWTFPSFKICRL